MNGGVPPSTSVTAEHSRRPLRSICSGDFVIVIETCCRAPGPGTANQYQLRIVDPNLGEGTSEKVAAARGKRRRPGH
jgi:hypothetical protein